MTHVGINYSTYQSCEPCDDGWDRGDTDGSVNNLYIATDDYGRGFDGFDTDLEPPFYAVYAEYYTGDTFGSDYRAEVIGVFKDVDEAREFADEARNFAGFGELSNGYYVPWNGYFEHLSNIGWEFLNG